jgi:hypothetical protein
MLSVANLTLAARIFLVFPVAYFIFFQTQLPRKDAYLMSAERDRKLLETLWMMKNMVCPQFISASLGYLLREQYKLIIYEGRVHHPDKKTSHEINESKIKNNFFLLLICKKPEGACIFILSTLISRRCARTAGCFYDLFAGLFVSFIL